MSPLPPRAEVKAIRWPSGAQAGCPFDGVVLIDRSTADPNLLISRTRARLNAHRYAGHYSRRKACRGLRRLELEALYGFIFPTAAQERGKQNDSQRRRARELWAARPGGALGIHSGAVRQVLSFCQLKPA
jgi:hypothetical protein